jgi:2-phospho-L-lactate/phosphoenolpyruvate guanylyltransferase
MVSRCRMNAGLLPVKRLADAKSRLARHFGPAEHLELTRALLRDALELVSSAPFIQWWVVTRDPEVEAASERAGIPTVADPGRGMNRAVQRGIDVAAGAGAGSVLVIPADIPLARPADLADLVDTAESSEVVVVPSRAGGGTNALAMRPPRLFAPRFGPGSLSAHAAIADEMGVRFSILSLPRLELDLDTIEDVDALLERGGDAHTLTVLERLRPVGGR